MLIRRLFMGLVPLALSATVLAQAPATHAESPVFTPARRVPSIPAVELPRKPPATPRSLPVQSTFTDVPIDRISCANCAPAPTLEANWGDGTFMSSKVMLIKGQNFQDGDTIEVDVMGDLAHVFLSSTSVTSQGGGFEFMQDFEIDIDTGVLQCSTPITVDATDLTALHASGQPAVPVQANPTGCNF
ncbi:MAG: hypothetical protein JOZ87_31075 [Chloroflexi bacterium]|nr:hypothetical protein [Chloroflexota bacterium]